MGIYTTSGAVVLKAGANVSTALTDTNYEIFIRQGEGVINTSGRQDFSGAYATLNNSVKYLLEDINSSLAAIYAVQYDMSGYDSRAEAEDIINVQRDSALRNIGILRDKKTQDFINGA